MPSDEPESSPYLNRRLRALYDACRESQYDDSGAACADCPVRDICEADWIEAADPTRDR